MKVKDITEKYRPCPFCGSMDIEIYGNTEIYEPKTHSEVKKVNIGCPDCGVWYDYLFDDEAEAIEEWNKRIYGSDYMQHYRQGIEDERARQNGGLIQAFSGD